jgi:anti-sigma factor RsiW
MNRHLPDDLILRFVEGDLDEHEAVEAALHIDDCAACAARAAQADPLAVALAAMPDPQLPAGFEDAVLDELAQPAAPTPAFQLPWLGVGLILAAALLMVVGGEPTALLWKLAAVARGLGVAITVLLDLLPSPATVLTIAATIALGSSLTAVRLLGLSRESA